MTAFAFWVIGGAVCWALCAADSRKTASEVAAGLLVLAVCVLLLMFSSSVRAQNATCRADGQGGMICFDASGRVTARCDARGNCVRY